MKLNRLIGRVAVPVIAAGILAGAALALSGAAGASTETAGEQKTSAQSSNPKAGGGTTPKPPTVGAAPKSGAAKAADSGPGRPHHVELRTQPGGTANTSVPQTSGKKAPGTQAPGKKPAAAPKTTTSGPSAQ